MRTILFLLLSFMSVLAWTTDFDAPVTLYASKEVIEFPRNPQGTMAIDSQGRLHWVYFIADEIGLPPNNRIEYQTYADGQQSSPIRVDSGASGGGRHPFLALDSHDTVHVAWQDYRHCTAAGHYMNNIEIYYDRKTRDGDFSSQDWRISHTAASHQGDNSYVPNVTLGSDGRVCIVWYDFNRNGNNADIFLRSSDANHDFTDSEGIEPYRITALTAADDSISYWFPCIAPFANGGLYVLWGLQKGFQGSFTMLGKAGDGLGFWMEEEAVVEQAGNFNDPPRLAAGRTGDLGLVYTKRIAGRSVIFYQHRPVDGTWSDPLQVNRDDLDANQPGLAFDSQGKAWIVWQEYWGDRYRVYFTSYDPSTKIVADPIPLSGEEADARTPAIALHPRTDQINVLWLDWWEEGLRTAVLRRETKTAIPNWPIYESSGQ